MDIPSTAPAAAEPFPRASEPDAAPGLRRDVHVRGVGRSEPRIAGAVASGLGLPVEAVVDAIYRAPACLLRNLDPQRAEGLASILRELGLDAVAVDAGPPPPRAPLLDVAIDLTDPLRVDEVAGSLANFTGLTQEAALDLLLEPPGVVMGRVSAATVAALERALPEGAAQVIVAELASSRFALFAASLTRAERRAIADLVPAGATFAADGGVTVFGLTREAAEAAWRRLKATDAVRIVNEAFLRFELRLTAVPAAAGTKSAALALEALAGVPASQFTALALLLPVAIESRIPFAELEVRMAAYAAAGFETMARLTTFEPLAIDVLAAPDAAFAAAGLARGTPPFRLSPLCEPRARVLRARLEAAGADVVFCGP